MSFLLKDANLSINNMIAENIRYALYGPTHTWDMNYKVYDKYKNKTYLIDLGDIYENTQDLDLYDGILYSDLVFFEIDLIKEVAWKII